MPEPSPRTSPAPSAAPLVRSTRPLTRTIRTRPLAVQGTLALDWQLPGEVSAVPEVPPLRLVPRDPALDLDTDPAVAVVATSRRDLPEPGTWCAQLVQALLEVLGHERPRSQLVRWLAPDVYAELGTHLAVSRPPATRGGRPRRTVSSVHVFEPADGVVEATAVVVGGRRARAVALRLEGWDGRWRCTRLALL
jgi:hypothetical protein